LRNSLRLSSVETWTSSIIFPVRSSPHLRQAHGQAVADLLQIIRARLMRFLVRRRVVEADGDTMLLAEDLEQRDPALAQLASAAVAGLPPAGPELRRKPLIVVLPAGSGPKVVRHLCVEDAGFSLHAATRAGAEDEVGRTNLFKYVLRPPIAQEHVTMTDDGLVAVQLKKPFRDGTAYSQCLLLS
jgi:Putative transposase.